MNKRRRRKVIVEAQEVVVVRRAKKQPTAWCGSCLALVSMMSPEDAVRLSGVTARTIYRWVQDERIHYIETPDGYLWICLESLLQKTGARGGLNRWGQPNSEEK